MLYLPFTKRVGLPVEGGIISVCDVFEIILYMIIILIIIIISLGKMLLSYNYFKHIAHAVVISTHGKRIGYVIIPKPNLSSRECINSCCRRFDLWLFAVWLNLSPL